MRWTIILYFLLVPATIGQSLARFELFLSTDRRLRKHPVTHGVTLEDGAFDGNGHLVIKGRGNPRTAAQFKVLTRYESGSARVLRISYFANIPSKGRLVLELRIASAMSSLRGVPLNWEETPDGIEISNGLIACVIPHSPHIAMSLLAHRKSRHDRSLTFTAGDFVGDGKLTVEEGGPLKLVIRQQGVVAIPKTSLTIKVDRRITIWRNRPEFDVETYFESELQRGRVGSLFLSCKLPRPPTLLLGENARLRSRRGLSQFDVIQPQRGRRHWHFPGRVDLAKRGPPGDAILIGSSAGFLSISIRDQRWVGPQVISLVDGKELTVDLVGPRHYWREGVRAGVAVRLAWQPIGRATTPLPFAEPVVLSLAIPAEVPAELRPLQSVLDSALEEGAAEETGLLPRGLEDAGDWMWSRDSAGNLEYDTIWGLSHQGSRRRAPRLIQWAQRSARHLINRDLDRMGTQLPLAHGRFHRMGRVELGHVWLEGLLELADRSADPFLRDSLKQMTGAFSDYVTAQNRRRLSSRSIGWGLLSTAALYDAGNTEELRSSARHLLTALSESAVDEWFVLSRRRKDGAGLVSTWVASGIVGEGIHRAVKVGLANRTWSSRHARFVERLADVAWDRRRRQLHSTIILGVDGIDSPEVSGLCTGEEMLFFALGLLRAGSAAGNDGLLSTARDVIAAAHDQLDLKNKKLCGKEVSQLAWLLPRLSECLR